MTRGIAALAAVVAVGLAYVGLRITSHDAGDDHSRSVTFPDGWSVRETSRLVERAGVRGSYIVATRSNPRAIPGLGRFAVPRNTKSLEGFLFPGTYKVGRTTTAHELVAQQLAAFRRRLPRLDARVGAHYTPYEALIVASLVEREAAVVAERRLVAAVIYNRLHHGMRLAIDATLRYRVNNWSRQLRVSNQEAESPYNTFAHLGLPPTPIGNPGLASLEAASSPAHVDYLYYVLTPCGEGTHAFSSTQAQFERDVAAYDKKRDELGGRDPTRC